MVARNNRLNERKTGMIAEEDIAKGLAELKAAVAQMQVKEVELQETKLHRAHVEQRRGRIQKIVKWATDAATKVRPSTVQPPGPARSDAEGNR